MTENEIAGIVIDVAYRVHVGLGPGLLESVYQEVMAHELQKHDLTVLQKEPIAICWDGLVFAKAFEPDLIVDDRVIVELKSSEKTHPVYYKQLLTYLRLADKRLGLLINFGQRRIKDGITRVVNGLPE